MSSKEAITYNGLGFGSIMAMILSWHFNKSIGWMILHGILSWFYVIAKGLEGQY